MRASTLFWSPTEAGQAGGQQWRCPRRDSVTAMVQAIRALRYLPDEPLGPSNAGETGGTPARDTVEADDHARPNLGAWSQPLRERSYDAEEPAFLTGALAAAAAAALGQAEHERVARLLAQSEVLRRSQLLPIPGAYRELLVRAAATLRLQLGEAAFAAAWLEGASLSTTQALADALGQEATPPSVTNQSMAPLRPEGAVPPEPAASAVTEPEATDAGQAGSLQSERQERMPAASAGEPSATETGPVIRLTDRERELLTLLIAGLGNRRIAAELVMSVRTVERHLANIYAKLDVHSKVEAITAALKQGLLPHNDER